ncbi:MAG: nitroreductase family protein [Clostridiales bacterium]|nr:nitroreductase family protein [Clostridiales bacterium]
MNETLKIIEKRYSCRDYKSEEIADKILQAIAKAAVQAPSGINRQPWRVIVVKDKDLMKDMEEAAMSHLASIDDKSTYERIMGRGGKLFYNAPCMIVVPVDSHSAMIDCGIVCQNIALAATSLGVDNVICGLTRNVFTNEANRKEFSKRLGFPEGYEFGCSVLLGYANTVKEPHEPDMGKITFI